MERLEKYAIATIVYRDGNWVTKQAECECGKYMDSEPTEGIPTDTYKGQSLV